MYKVVGINRKHAWTYGDKSGTNQLIYVINSQAMTFDGAEGHRTDVIKCPGSFDTSMLKVGENYDFAFNKYGTLEGISLVSGDKK